MLLPPQAQRGRPFHFVESLATGDGKKIRTNAKTFLLEDDSTNALVMQGYLRLAGFPAATPAVSLAEAEEYFEDLINEEFDLAVFDLMLPDGESFDLVRRIRAESDCLIVAYTARCSPKEKSQMLAAGFDAVLSKPLSLEEFKAELDDHFE